MNRSMAVFLILAACASCSGTGNTGALRLDEPLGPGQVRAGVVTRESELLKGIDAHGWLGDFKLYNSRVAFIVENIDQPRGWCPYGGTLLDADIIRQEGQEGEELFEEMMPFIDWMTLYPTEWELLSDGSQGEPAAVRIRGEHRGVPLIDAAVNGAFLPKDLEMEQQYILEPDADYLRVRMLLRSQTASAQAVTVGDLVLNGDQTTDLFPGIGPGTDIGSTQPAYFAGVSRNTCYLYAPAQGSIQSAISIEGITPMIVANGSAPADPQAEPLVVERWLVVGSGGLDSCLRAFNHLRGTAALGQVGGVVTAGGNPEENVQILVQDTTLPEGQNYVSQTYSGSDGRYELQLPAGSYRLELHATGRDVRLVDLDPLAAGQSLSADVGIPAAARVAVSCQGDGPGGAVEPLPCKLSLQQGHDAAMSAPVYTDFITFFPSGSGEAILPEGEWTATLSRGWEYGISRQNITASAGNTVNLQAQLDREVDTSGYLAADLHNHSTRSIDSTYDVKDKIASNACEGVELVVLTDHDCQSDFTRQVQEMIDELSFDLVRWMRLVTGNEISPMYAHHTAFPLPSHPTGWIFWQVPWTQYHDGRFVRYLEYPEIFARDRELGAQVINVAHPLSSSGYFNYLGFDPPDVILRIDSLDPVKFSPDFDTLELLNSKDVDTMLEHILPMWSALNNQGFFRTASGVSDTHQRDGEAGFGRTLVASSTDQPAQMDLEEIWLNLKAGRAMVGGGIFVVVSVAGKGMGELVPASGPVTALLHVEAACWVPVQEVCLLANGECIQTFALEAPGVVDPAHPATRYHGEIPLTLTQDTWIAAVAYGSVDQTLNPVFRGARPVGLANAIRLDVDGNGRFDPPE